MIFIDEIDAVGYRRGGAAGIGSGNRETETTLN
jgi:cell division protease FtsH